MTQETFICTVFIDGGYVRRALKGAGLSDEMEPREPGRWLYSQGVVIAGRRAIADRTYYYDAIDEDASEAESTKMEKYLKTIEALPEVRVGNPGWLRRSPSPRKVRQQKAVDVQLAVDALELAFSRRDGGVVVVAGDGDFAPLLDGIRRAGPYAIVLAFSENLAQPLADAADRVVYMPTPLTSGWQLS